MESEDSIFMKRHLAISVVCTILITYPNMMWIPWNVSSLLPDEVTAFKVNSIDYLLKPIKKEELQKALDKYRQRTPVELVILRLIGLLRLPMQCWQP